jgi:predicted O-methyltransferase YrrM
MRKPDIHRLMAYVRQPALRPLFSIPTHLTDRERVTLFKLARRATQTVSCTCNALEIGSYLGASASFIAAGIGAEGSVYCIDTWANDAMSEGQRDTYAEFLDNTAVYRKRIFPLKGWSHDASVLDEVRAKVGHIDILFIDGDHSREGVLRDWQLYSPFLVQGSIVAMHDIGWATGVQQVVAEEIRPRVRNEHRLPNLWWAEFEC